MVIDAILGHNMGMRVHSRLFSPIPMRYLYGERVMAWSRRAWFLVYGLGMFVFVQTIMHPQSTRYGGNPNASPASMLLLFIVFTMIAMAFRLFFRVGGGPEQEAAAELPAGSLEGCSRCTIAPGRLIEGASRAS